jgi:hypothetical protein
LEGLRREYSYFRVGKRVGNYTFWVEEGKERAGGICLLLGVQNVRRGRLN